MVLLILIALTALIKEKNIYVQAGAGIVADSNVKNIKKLRIKHWHYYSNTICKKI